MAGLQHSVGFGGTNVRSEVRLVQQLLNRHRAGHALLKVDGIAGVHTLAAIREFQGEVVHLHPVDGRVDPQGPTMTALQRASHTTPTQSRPAAPRKTAPAPAARAPAAAAPAAAAAAAPQAAAASHSGTRNIAWGAKVPAAFKRKVLEITDRLDISPDFLMSCMAFESGETFSPSIRNAAGSGAVGLIQFMPSTAKALHTSTAALAALTAEQQLDYVERYFRPYRGRIRSIEDIYMTILYPKAIGHDTEYVLFSGTTKAYRQNKGLDANHDQKVNKFEAASAVRAKYQKGLRPGYIG